MTKYRDKQLVEKFSQAVNNGYEMSDELRCALRTAVIKHAIDSMNKNEKTLFKHYLEKAAIG